MTSKNKFQKKKVILKRRRNPVIALAQIEYFDITKRHNLEKIKRYIRKAKKAKADIICFPEGCIHKDELLNKNHKIVKEIAEECKKNNIWCIVNEDMKINGKPYNTSILIDRQGKIVGDYKKINLYGDKKVKPGKKIIVFKTDFAKIGIVVCWDIAFPALFKKMKLKGAEIIFCPSQWWYDAGTHKRNHKRREIQILESMVLARAYENVFFVAICNPILSSKFQISYTAIASPTRIIKKLVGEEGMITAKINLNKIKKVERIINS